MSKYIGEGINRFGSTLYVVGFNGKNVSLSSNNLDAILISESDKKAINEIVKKECLCSFKLIKLNNYKFKTDATNYFLEEYDKTPIFDLAKFLKGKDCVNVECLAMAKTDLEGIDTFKQFGEIVANKIIEENNLQKKGTDE